MADNDISKMKVADLKKELKNRGLSTVGNKNELHDRLQAAIVDGSDSFTKHDETANSEDLLEDDILNDDDDELIHEDEKALLNESQEDGILKSPTASDKSTKDDSPEFVPQKKVALKRNVSITTPVLASTVASDIKPIDQSGTAENGNENKAESDEPDKKVIKLKDLTAQERLELRAKKFGGAVTTATPSSNDAAKKEARAARFGLSSGNIATNSESSVEQLRKRAERFGVSVSNKMIKIEMDEKKLKRQERFGGGDSVDTTKTSITIGGGSSTTPSAGKVDYAEKARLRLERFASKT
uniref:Putative wing disc dorsal/ventral pattern formation n=1 Tax=Corethrella appendiculata TaxID=1370023 RepID=U5EZW7_9DIPT